MQQSLKIISAEAGQRLDLLLTLKLGRSRSYWQKHISGGHVKVNAAPVKASYRVEAKDAIEIIEVDSKAAEAPKLNIVYEDEFLLVVDKPAGLLVHDIPGRPVEPTVAGFARTKSSDSDPDRPGIVHRLDRDTSGLMIIAKDAASKSLLQEQFRRHLVKKTYILLVAGHLKEAEALIDLPIGRRSDTAKRAVMPSGKPAQTAYRVIQEYAGYSLIEASPHSGRTHQLRVHFAHLGHAIAGDRLYGPVANGPGRLFLHASKLEFSGMNGQPISVELPLPSELEQFLATL